MMTDEDDAYGSILVDANSLRKSSIQKREIREHVTGILRQINDKLIESHEEGMRSVITELPIIFEICNMKLLDAQREVWSTVIEHLKEKNYRVTIDSRGDQCTLKITWFSKADEMQIKHQYQVLAKHSKKIMKQPARP